MDGYKVFVYALSMNSSCPVWIYAQGHKKRTKPKAALFLQLSVIFCSIFVSMLKMVDDRSPAGCLLPSWEITWSKHDTTKSHSGRKERNSWLLKTVDFKCLPLIAWLKGLRWFYARDDQFVLSAQRYHRAVRWQNGWLRGLLVLCNQSSYS